MPSPDLNKRGLRGAGNARPWIVLAGGDFTYKGIMALYWIFLARNMSVDGVGAIALANAIALPAFVIVDAGLTTLLIRDYSESGGLVRSHFRRVRRRIFLAAGLLLPLAGLGFALSGNVEAAVATGLMSLAYFFDFLGQLMLSPSRSAAVMEPDALVRFIQAFGTVSFTLVVVWLDHLSPAWVALASVLAYALALYPAIRVWRGSRRWADHDVTDSELDLGTKEVTQGTILMAAFGRADSLLVQAVLGPASLAAYTVAYKLIEVARLVPGALSRIVLARSSDADDTSYDPREHLYLGIGVSALIGACVVIAGPGIIGLLFGEEYRDSAGTAIQIMGISTVPFAVVTAGTMYAVGGGKPDLYRRIALESLIALIVTVTALSLEFGLEGAAAGMLVSQTYAAVRFWGILHRHQKRPVA